MLTYKITIDLPQGEAELLVRRELRKSFGVVYPEWGFEVVSGTVHDDQIDGWMGAETLICEILGDPDDMSFETVSQREQYIVLPELPKTVLYR